MMKQPTLALLSLLLLVNFMHLSAQSQIQGVVLESETGESVILGTVALYKYGVLINGTQTDFDGSYVFSDVSHGLYHVEVSYVGMRSMVQEIEISQDRVYHVNFLMNYEDMGCCGIATTSCSFYDPPLFELDQFTQRVVLYPNRRPEGKNYVLFKDRRSAIEGEVTGIENTNVLSGEVRIDKKDELIEIHDLSQNSKFMFYSLRKGKYRVEVNAEGYQKKVINVRLKGRRQKAINIQLDNPIEI